MMIKKCTDCSASNLCTVIPYMAYARQDRAFVEGEVVSIALVAKLLETVGTKQTHDSRYPQLTCVITFYN